MKNVFTFFLLLIYVQLVNAQSYQPGLDQTFGNGGIHIDSFSTDYVQDITDLKIQSDGKIITIGTFIVRHLPNGDLDSSFGGTGFFYSSKITAPYSAYPSALRIAPDGKLIIAGSINSQNSFVARVKPNGKPDSSFGINGYTRFCCGASNLILLADGRVLVAGSTGREYFTVHRFLSNGDLDSSFGTSGQTSVEMGDYYSNVVLLDTLKDQKIILVGEADSPSGIHKVALMRLLPNGVPDSTFGGVGKVYSIGTDYCRGAVKQPDGKIIVSLGGLDFNEDAMVTRLTTNGDVDATFGQGGFVDVPGFRITGSLITDDGKIVVAGFNDEQVSYRAARINNDGKSIDSGFGTFGYISTNIHNYIEQRSSVVAQQRDGKIILAGSNRLDKGLAPYEATMVRYEANASVSVHSPISPTAALALFPNPAHASISVILPAGAADARLQIFSITGALLQSRKANEATTLLDISALPAGTYLLRAQGAQIHEARLFTKQ